MKHMIPVYVLMLIWVSAAAVEKSETLEKSITLGADGSLTVIADDGEIVVSGTDGDAVEVIAVKRVWGRSNKAAEERLEMLDVDFQKTGNRLVIKAIDRLHDEFSLGDILDGDFWRSKGWQDDRIDFELKVPVRTRLKLKTDEGDVEVNGTEGDIRVEVDEGDILLESVKAGEIRVKVDEGTVRLQAVESGSGGYCDISGDESTVRLKDVRLEDLNIYSDEGHILFDRVTAKEVDVTTDEGDMALQLFTAEGGRYSFVTDEGTIEIGLSPDADCRVYLKTDEGEILSDYDLEKQQSDDGEKCHGTIGGSSNSILKANTEEGDILLRKFEP